MSRDRAYWRANLALTIGLLTIWVLIAFGGAVWGIRWLNQFRVGELGAGFWLAQQGSIVAFVLLVLTYAVGMDLLDRKYRGKESR